MLLVKGKHRRENVVKENAAAARDKKPKLMFPRITNCQFTMTLFYR